MSDTNEPEAHFHKRSESCADCDERRRLIKATPVEIVATWEGHVAAFTVPLWMLHVFTKMARELDAQTPGVTYVDNAAAHRLKPSEPSGLHVEFKGGSRAFREFMQEPDADA